MSPIFGVEKLRFRIDRDFGCAGAADTNMRSAFGKMEHRFMARLRLGGCVKAGGVIFVFLVAFLAVPGSALADLLGHGGMVRAVATSADGRHVATGSFDYSVRIWDFAEQSETAVLEGHTGPVNAVAFTGIFRVASAGDDGAVIVWDIAAKKPEFKLEGHGHKVMGLAVSPDGRHLATAGWDRTVRLWAIADGTPGPILSAAQPLNAVVFADGGALVVAAGHDGALHLWDLQTGAARGRMEGHERGVTQLAVSADGRRILSAGIDGTVRLWDVKAQRALAVFRHHESQVYGVSFLPGDRRAISTGRGGILAVWSLADGKLAREIRAHDAMVWATSPSPDGRFAVTVGSDGSGRIWHLETGDRIGVEAAVAAEPQPWLTDPHPGARLFSKCARCHALTAAGAGKSGPHFAGLFGRRVGSLAEYRYSGALQGASFVWDEATLFRLFNEGPDVMLPGTKMPVQRLTDDGQLRQLIDYLRRATAP
ncbi:MAG: c-type cytochrome [Alphaproteobacteria bacterium]|nr:c-type cytochrome [Alphaproteobacteria bacterium]